MSKIIAIANQKGGVGKTTTSINVAAGLAYLNKKVLLIDLDPQGNATQGIGYSIGVDDKTIYDCLLDGVDVSECIKHLSGPTLDLLPSNVELSGAEIELSRIENNKEKVLSNTLFSIRDNYDFIIIDCPPSLGLLNTNALTAADSVLIPIQCEFFALEGVTQLLQTIRIIQKVSNPDLKIEGVLLTMYNATTSLSSEVSQEVRKHFKEKAYKTYIPVNIKLAEAPSYGKCIYNYDINSKGAKAYAALTKEIVLANTEEVNG